MIIRIIIYILIAFYFLKDFPKEDKKFKLLIIPILLISFFGTMTEFKNLDIRIRIFIIALEIILSIGLLYYYSKDYQFEKRYELKKKRDQRRRNAKDRQLIVENKNLLDEEENTEDENSLNKDWIVAT